MYKVVFPPFKFATTRDVGVAIVKVVQCESGEDVHELVLHSFTSCDCVSCRKRPEKFEEFVSRLNDYSQEDATLLEIQALIQRSLNQRMESLSRADFRADFGRMDIGQRQGFGYD